MFRALLFPLTMMLLIATAMAMLASALLLPVSHATEGSVVGGTEVVERFYAAVNEAIATGDPAALRRVVNPAFADETPLPGVNPGRAGLEEYLVALHDADPAVRLEAEVISAGGNQVVAQVQLQQEPTLISRPAAWVERRAIWSPIEVFGVADGAIVSRWGHTDGLTLSRLLAEQTLELPIPTRRVVSLMRVTLAPGARWDAPRVEGPRLLVLEAGVLDVQAVLGSAGEGAQDAGTVATASDGGRTDVTQQVMLTAGRTWQAPAGAITSMSSVGRAEAHLLAVTFAEPQIPNGTFLDAEHLPFGVTAQVLAGDLATSLGTGAVTVTLEQVSFAPHAGLNLWSTAGPVLIAVQTGQLKATTLGTAWVRRNQDGMSVASRADVLSAENGMLLQPDGVVVLRNGEQGAAQALVVTIRRHPRQL